MWLRGESDDVHPFEPDGSFGEDDEPAEEDEPGSIEPDLPPGLYAAARLFARLTRRRAHQFHFLAPPVFAGKAPIIALRPIATPLAVSDIEALARTQGFRGALRAEIIADVMLFDEVYLELDCRALADHLAAMNR